MPEMNTFVINGTRYEVVDETARNNINGLTPAQIGAAPAGYGYGEPAISIGRFATEQELNTGLSAVVNKMRNLESKQILFVDAINGEYSCAATVYRHSASYALVETRIYATGGTYHKLLVNGTWQPTAWVNPPMRPGVEYRTTERWDGKVVYIQMLDFGALPNSTGKNMSVTVSGATKVQCIDFGGFFRNANGSITGALLGLKEFVGHSFSCTTYTFTLGIVTNGDVSAFNAFPVVKYTKD